MYTPTITSSQKRFLAEKAEREARLRKAVDDYRTKSALSAVASVYDVIETVEPPEPKIIRTYLPSKDIIKEVADYYGVSYYDLIGRRKPPKIADARRVAFYLVYKYTTLSSLGTGRVFGRDHTCVLYAVRNVKLKLADIRCFQLRVDIKTILGKLGVFWEYSE